MNIVQVAVGIILAALAGAALRAEQIPPRSAKEGVYSAAQANQGKTVYDEKCAACHGRMQTVTPDMLPPMSSNARVPGTCASSVVSPARPVGVNSRTSLVSTVL
jgi:cytochrome c5